MKRLITTVCSDDHFQYYAPLFVWGIRNCSKNIDIKIIVNGSINDNILNYLIKNNVRIIERKIHGSEYVNNVLRFLWCEPGYDEVLITDIDLFYSNVNSVFEWYNKNKTCEYYSGHAGPLHRPHRPKICNSWEGDFERVAGGFFVYYPKWIEKTKKARNIIEQNMFSENSIVGKFRESDEVILGRIIKHSDLPMPKRYPFPRKLRQLHFGDFKESMQHRYKNQFVMRKFLDPSNAKHFLKCLKDKSFLDALDLSRKNSILSSVIDNTIRACNEF